VHAWTPTRDVKKTSRFLETKAVFPTFTFDLPLITQTVPLRGKGGGYSIYLHEEAPHQGTSPYPLIY